MIVTKCLKDNYCKGVTGTFLIEKGQIKLGLVKH